MLNDVRALVSDMIRDHSDRVETEQLDRAIGLAVTRYGQDRPRCIVEDVTAPGGRVLAYPTRALRVTDIEYPIGNRPAAMIDAANWYVYSAPAGKEIVLPFDIPFATLVRLSYQEAHELSDDADTIAEDDREAIGSYAAAILFDQISAATSADGNPTITADAVNHQSKPENFAKRAERLRQRYYDLLGLDPKRVKAASVNVPVKLPSTTGGRRLLHGRRSGL